MKYLMASKGLLRRATTWFIRGSCTWRTRIEEKTNVCALEMRQYTESTEFARVHTTHLQAADPAWEPK